MRADLLRAVAGQRVEATPVMSDADKTTIIGGPVGYDDWDDEDAQRRRRRGIIAAVVTGVLVLAGVVGLVIALNSGEEAPPPVAQVEVPQLVGELEADARTAITAADLRVGTVSPAASSAQDEGRVLSSDPAPGARVDPETTVTLVVGSGPDTITVPGVVGLQVQPARGNLTGAGFTNVTIDNVPDLAPAGQVIAVDPGEGAAVAPDAAITLQVSQGTAPVPDVTGLSQEQAVARLEEVGFTNVTVSTGERSDVPQGTVFGTEPGANTQLAANDEITVLVAVPEPVETATPTPTGPPTPTPTPTPTPIPTPTTGP
jgi:serine/threonine-protein kinase